MKYSNNSILIKVLLFQIVQQFRKNWERQSIKNSINFQGLSESSYTEKTDIIQGCSHADVCNLFDEHSIVTICISWPCKYRSQGDSVTQVLIKITENFIEMTQKQVNNIVIYEKTISRTSRRNCFISWPNKKKAVDISNSHQE